VVKINIEEFLNDIMIDIKDLAKAFNIPLPSIYAMKYRGTIRRSLVSQIAEKYPQILNHIKVGGKKKVS